MASVWIAEAIDVLEKCGSKLMTCLPSLPQDQFCFDGFEECLHRCTFKSIALSTNGCFEAKLDKVVRFCSSNKPHGAPA